MSQIVLIGNWIRQFDTEKLCEESEKAFLKTDEYKEFSRTSLILPNRPLANIKLNKKSNKKVGSFVN